MSQAVKRKKPHPLKGKGGVVALGIVVVLGIWLAFDLKKPVRDPDANPFVSDYAHVLSTDVTRVELKRPKAPFTLVKQDGKWRFEAPGRFRADREQVESWLKSLLEGGIVPQTVEAQNPDPKQYGLDKPTVELVLTSGGSTRTIQLGRDFRRPEEKGTGELSFAWEREDGRLFMLNSAQVIALRDKTIDEMRDRKLLDVAATKDVKKLTLIRPAVTLEAERSGEGWTMTQPFRASADKNNIETLIDQLRLGTAVNFVEDDAKDLSKYSLDKPRLIAQVMDGKGVHGLRLGGTAKDGKVYAAREGENQVVSIEKTSFDGFDKTAADLRELRLMTLDNEKVNMVELRNPYGTSRLQRTGKQEWELVDPKGGKPQKANVETVERILSALGASAFRHVEEAPKDMAKYGLDKPRITVTVSDGGGTQVVTLGKTNPQGDYYTKGAPDAVFTVKSFTYADLNVLPAALLPPKPDAPK